MQLILSLLKYHSGSPRMLWDRQALPRGRWSQLPPTPQQGHTGTWTNFNIACGAKTASAFLFPRYDCLSCACGTVWLLGTMAARLACSCSRGNAVPSSSCLGDERLLHSATAWPFVLKLSSLSKTWSWKEKMGHGG